MISPRPLTVAHVTAERDFSGGEVQVFLLMEGLRKRGHKAVLLCPPASRSEAEAKRRGIETRPVRLDNDWSPLGVRSLQRELAATHADLVHLHSGRATWLGAIAAWRLGLHAVTTRRMERPVKRGWRTRFVYRTALHSAAAISCAVERCLVEGGVPAARVRVIPSAVDPAELHPQQPRESVRAREGVGHATPCLLVVAALIRRKGIDLVIDAMARLASRDPAPVLWIAGEGPERAALERQARNSGLGDRVCFLGEREDVPDLLHACDVFVLPSRHEGLGVAALEAMAAGCPVIASAVGGLAEAVAHDETGWVVPPDDPASLADALERLLEDPALRERLGAAGPPRIAERYAADRMVSSYEDLYFEVLAETGQR